MHPYVARCASTARIERDRVRSACASTTRELGAICDKESSSLKSRG